MFLDARKFLVQGCWELIAAIGARSDRTIADCRQFVRQLGVTEPSTFTTEALVDSEPSLAALVRKVGLQSKSKLLDLKLTNQLVLRRGAFDACIKKMVACFCSNMRSHGFDLTRSSKRYLRALTICFTNAIIIIRAI